MIYRVFYNSANFSDDTGRLARKPFLVFFDILYALLRNRKAKFKFTPPPHKYLQHQSNFELPYLFLYNMKLQTSCQLKLDD